MNKEEIQLKIEDICSQNPTSVKYSVQLRLSRLFEDYSNTKNALLLEEIKELKALKECLVFLITAFNEEEKNEWEQKARILLRKK